MNTKTMNTSTINATLSDLKAKHKSMGETIDRLANLMGFALPCKGGCEVSGQPHCESRNRMDMQCTRIAGHDGDHVACGTEHAMAVWPQDKPERKLHNPGGLTPEQYGASDGYRLLFEDEVLKRYDISEYMMNEIQQYSLNLDNEYMWSSMRCGSNKLATYRTKLSPEQLAERRKGL